MSESELISKLTANGGTYGSGGNQQQQQQQSSNNLDHSGGQEMDIDILQVKTVLESLKTQINRQIFFQQVQDVTVEMPFPSKKEETNNCTTSAPSPDASSLNSTTTTSSSPNNSTSLRISSELMQTDEQQQQSQSEILWWRDTLNFDKCNLALVGFSKGCVVLNQVRLTMFLFKRLLTERNVCLSSSSTSFTI